MAKSVQDKINDGDYKNKLPFAKQRDDFEAHKRYYMDKHWLGRPSKTATSLQRWTGKRWIKDDGKPGLSFSGKINGIPQTWGPHCSCTLLDKDCPCVIAMLHTLDRFPRFEGTVNWAVMTKEA
jgi:hypothetical protein